MRLCSNCHSHPVFGTDKLTKLGYCKGCQYKRTDLDRRSITVKGLEKAKKKAGFFDINKVDEDFTSGASVVGEAEIDNNIGISESLVNLSNDLDYVFSLFIRHKYADKHGMVKCFTCPVVLPIKDIQNGHYKKRGHKATRFLEQNCRPQCPNCNKLHNEDESIYKKALEFEYEGITDWLDEQASLTYKATRDELKQLLIEYRSKIQILKKKYES